MSRLKTAQELFKRDRRPGDLVFAVVFLAFALFMLWCLPEQAPWNESAKLAGQPALWPTISVFGMAGFGLLHFLGSIASPRIPGRWAEVVIWLRAAEFGGWFVGYVLILPLVGYLPASLFFGVALTYRLGYRSAQALGAAALLALVTVALFRGLLHANVPAGQLYQYLPDGLRAFAQTYL
jgi:hypothetical protein